jgi:hypothetical protein
LRSITLTLIYSTLSLPSWSAGSRQVACSIGATLGNGGWATLLNSAKGALRINGQPPVPPPDIPQERLNLPTIPITPDTGGSSASSSSGSSTSQQRQGNNHLPGQAPATQEQPAPAAPPPAQPAPGAPAPEAPPPPAPEAPPPPPPPPAPEAPPPPPPAPGG